MVLNCRALRFALAPIVTSILVATLALQGRPPLVIRWLQSRFPEVVFYVRSSERIVALTIDDGPTAASTREMAGVLRKFQATATFFILGDRAVEGRETLTMLVRNGHELGNHFQADPVTARLSGEEIEKQLLQTDEVLTPIHEARWARPGSGWFNRRMLAIVGRHGYRLVLGSVYPLDAHLPSVYLASRHILRQVHPGAIIILHDGDSRGRRTVEVFRRILPELRRRGYKVVTFSELLAAGASP